MLNEFKRKLFSDSFTIPDFLSQKHFPSFDGIRAFSILFVITAHLNFKLQNSIIQKLFNGGMLGVHIFFVVSGLLITILLIKEKVNTKNVSLKTFYIRRALRILPVAFLHILVLVLLNYRFDLGIQPSNFIHQATFTVNFMSAKPWYIGHYWSLGVEEQFYLLFPFLFKKSIRLYVIVLIAVPILSLILGAALDYHTSNLILSNSILYSNIFINQGLYSIAIGSLAGILVCKFPININLNPRLVGVLQCVLLFGVWFFFSHPMPEGINILIESGFIAVLILSTVYFKTGFYKLLNLKFIKFIGVLSYSIYIWQQIFTSSQPWANSFTYGASIPLNLLLLSVVVYVSYNYFEKPFLTLKNKFKPI